MLVETALQGDFLPESVNLKTQKDINKINILHSKSLPRLSKQVIYLQEIISNTMAASFSQKNSSNKNFNKFRIPDKFTYNF